jgi:hypothetical protein
VTFPARVQLIAAMNPCRCGHLGDPALGCSRAPKCAADYQSKVSGPLLDRIDLHVEVDPVSAADLALPPPAEGSAQVARGWAPRAAPDRAAGRQRTAQCRAGRRPARSLATPDEAGRSCCSGGRGDAPFARRLYPASCAWRAPLPIWPVQGVGRCMWPRRSAIAGQRRA